ncbi:hypothetical protein BJF92_04870 [Rhizobium rhizosphaerae]|uniref:Phosphohistidine phosphatase n=1 Tax=Xaviernesmea rhizosphaerae TaxID=1672749 RepID=A0A1Q9AG24_9HYPH|nr:histidine phosphatase family protein [Xaviernesmea rhizosphaerae]OLP53913.1 hypothetical protein BJF92_04870 [Xaviernesmea rhizosphaerae]OQP88078.1 hypothetical protein BTR14_00970 [Xaviernesmea rhizosphaerae]
MTPDPAPEFRLFLLRHARAAQAKPGLRDVDRTLDPVGEGDATHLALRLSGLGLIPEMVLCSPARRCRQTVMALQGVAGDTMPVQVVDALYSGGAEVYLHAALAQNCGSVLICGHNPVIDELLRALVGEDLPAGLYDQGYPPAGLAVIDFDRPPGAGVTGRLAHWIDPHQ